MTPTEKAMDYARKHVQAVRICWLDRQPTECGAVEAVKLCADRYVSDRIWALWRGIRPWRICSIILDGE